MLSTKIGPELQARRSHNSMFRPSLGLFASLAILYVLTAWLLMPPPLGTGDTAYFKEAGANLVMGEGFTSAFAFGNPTAEAKVYAGYPPGHPLAFAGLAALLGVGLGTNALFEALVNSIVVVIAYVLLSRAFKEAPGWEAWSLFGLMLLALLSRYTISQGDRPDPLGLTFALLSLFPGLRSLRASWTSSLLVGFALLMSFICGVLAIAGVALRWVLESTDQRQPLWIILGIGFFGSLIPLAFAVVVISSFDPSYAERLFGFVQTFTKPTLSAAGGALGQWWEMLTKGSQKIEYWLAYARPVILLSVATPILYLARSQLSKHQIRLSIAVVWGTILFSEAVVPWNKHYGGLATGLFLPALAIGLPAGAWRRALPRYLLLGAVFAIVFLRLPFEAYSRWAQAGLGPSLERMEAVLAREDFEDRTNDGAVWIAVDAHSYFLVKPLGHRLLASGFELVGLQDFIHLIDYVVMGYGPGGGPETPRRPLWWPDVAEEFELLYRPELPQFVTLFGFRLSNSSYSWETEIWRRR